MRSSVVAAIAAVASSFTLASGAVADNVKVGSLRCKVSAGLGLIVTSTKALSCSFIGARGFHEFYTGGIQKFGLDIGQTNPGVLLWDVFAPTGGERRGALAGGYGGVGASATIGAGLGANVLVGGLNGSFALQPISVETQTGLNLAAGVESLTLQPVHAVRRTV